MFLVKARLFYRFKFKMHIKNPHSGVNIQYDKRIAVIESFIITLLLISHKILQCVQGVDMMLNKLKETQINVHVS